MAVTMWRMFCYFLKKRGKGKQLIWTTQYVIVETLTNARCCFVANKSQKIFRIPWRFGIFCISLQSGNHPKCRCAPIFVVKK